MGSSPARASFAKKEDYNNGPGQYDDGKDFGRDTKSFRIGEKRQERVVESMGPGQYSPERAEVLTKTKTVTIDMGRSAARPASFAKQGGADVAPG